MALVSSESFSRVNKYRNTVHKQTNATFTVFEHNGQKYFQIDTYGTTERIMPEKVSQSVQFNKDMATMLIEILRREFSID